MYDHYLLLAGPTILEYTFTSEGPKGQIQKLIQFTQYEGQDFYNLAFGNTDEDGGIDDLVISNNGDI